MPTLGSLRGNLYPARAALQVFYETIQISPGHGELPVNTDGGLKCFGHPIGASGLRMLYEAYKQLQDKAGPRQVKNATIALTHNLAGTPRESSVSGINILGRRNYEK